MTVTVITGASRGIGKALAFYYESLGHEVHPVSRWHGLDVNDAKAVGGFFRALRRVDNLINCAAAASLNHMLLTPKETVAGIFSTNVVALFHLCQEAARKMKGGGRIVNFTSVAAPLNLPGEAAYAASKAAVESLTRTLAHELHPITVNAIGPNPIATDLIKGVPHDKLAALLKRQANPRLGTMADVINVVDFFLRPESNFITGQTLYLGGIS